MQHASLRAVVTLLVLVVSHAAAHAARSRPEPCPPGRYLVEAAPLLEGDSAAGEVITVSGAGDLTVSGLCPPVPAARIKARRKATKAKARWASCGELSKVRLKLRVGAPECVEARGVLKAKRMKRKRFVARRLPPCRDLDPTEATIQAAVDAALLPLTDPRNDPIQFRAMVTGIETRLACSLGWVETQSSVAVPAPQQRAPHFETYDDNVDYCGRLSSADDDSLTLRGDSECLNRTCFEHDACYIDGCVEARCSWAGQSDDCDDAMFRKCAEPTATGGCWEGPGWSTTDSVICAIARGLHSLQDRLAPEGCDEPPCPEGECNSESGMCESTTTTTVTTTTVTSSSVTTVTSVTSTTATTATTITFLAPIVVIPRSTCLGNGETLQLHAIVDGVENPTITWTRAVGWGSVSASGLYTAPSIGITDDVITAEAEEAPGAIDWANIHVSECNCVWSASITGANLWLAGGWYNEFISGAGVTNFLFIEDGGPSGETRGGSLGLSIVGDLPAPGGTAAYRANFVYNSASGQVWQASQEDDDLPAPLWIFIDEFTGDTMRAEVRGMAARREPDGTIIDTVDVAIDLQGTRFSGSVNCE